MDLLGFGIYCVVDNIDSAGEGVRSGDGGGGESGRYIEIAYHLCDDRQILC